MNAKLSNLTPLGISHPLRPTTKPTNAKVTPFEETIKRDKIPETQPAEFVFDDGYREHGGMIKKEESVSPIEDKSFLESIPFSSESNSRNTSKIKDKGKEKEKEKENLRPDGAFGLSRTGRYTLRSNLLEDEVSNTSSQQSRTLSPAASQATSSGTGPPHQHPHQHPKPTLAKVTTEGPDFSVHASSTSRISLPDTESFTSLKSAEDGKPSTKDYRKPTFESDADDEFEASDKETHDGSDEGAVDDKEDEYAERDADDDGLHSAMNKIQLGKRSRGDDDDVGKDFGDFGMQPARPTEGLTLQMRDPREEERERDIAEENEVQSKEMDDAENAAPAKRRKGSDGQLVSAQNLGSQ